MIRTLILSAIILALFTACSIADKDASTVVKDTIEKTLDQPSVWHGSYIVKSERGGTLLHVNYDGEHDGDEYTMSIDTQGTGFGTQVEVKRENDEIYIKLPKSGNWQKTTPQDLNMLGLDFANSPIELAKSLRELDLIIQTTDRQNVYKILVKDEKKLPGTEKVVEVTGIEDVAPIDPAEIFVEVNPNNQTMRSLNMSVAYTDGSALWYDVHLERSKGDEKDSN